VALGLLQTVCVAGTARDGRIVVLPLDLSSWRLCKHI
jgi:hypothetical protein